MNCWHPTSWSLHLAWVGSISASTLVQHSHWDHCIKAVCAASRLAHCHREDCRHYVVRACSAPCHAIPWQLNQITPHSGYQINPETQKVMVGNLTVATELSEVQPSEVSSLPARPINTLSSLPSSSSPLFSTAHCPSTLSQRRAPRSTLISLSTQYEWKPLYFCISNVSHWHGLIATHCTNVVPPAAYVSLCDHSLMLHVQVTPFTQHHFSIEQSVCNLGHFQQFRQCLIEPVGIHMQHHSQNLVKPAPPPYYCGDIVVLFIVLYCITLTAVSCLTCTVTGMTSHTTHHTAWLSSQVACLYSLLFSCSTLPLMCT